MKQAPGDRLIVALDQPELRMATALVERLDGVVEWFKVGLELFSAAGPVAIETIRARGAHVFLDLKLHDIPETVRRAARIGSATGAELLTVHAAGGPAMLAAAVEGARQGGTSAVLAVTVLTSLDLDDLDQIGCTVASVEDLVVRRARLAMAAGCAGIVASPREARAVRQAIGPSALIVTPGVRPRDPGRSADDQKRAATAADAVAAGADRVVVGRPIAQASDPRRAAVMILEELGA